MNDIETIATKASENPFVNLTNRPYVFKITDNHKFKISLFSEEEKGVEFVSGTLDYNQFLKTINQLELGIKIDKIIFICNDLSPNLLLVNLNKDLGDNMSCTATMPCFKTNTTDAFLTLDSGSLFVPLFDYKKGLTVSFNPSGISHVLVYVGNNEVQE